MVDLPNGSTVVLAGPVNLWGLAQVAMRRDVEKYLRWLNASPEDEEVRQLAEAELASYPLSFLPDDREAAFRSAKDRQAQWLRFRASEELLVDIGVSLRPVLMSGEYKVTARRGPEGERLTLTAEDLAGLNVRLVDGTLWNRTTRYTDVAVTPAGSNSPAPFAAPAGRVGPQITAALAVIQEIWPKDNPLGAHKAIAATISKRLVAQGAQPVSEDTVARARALHRRNLEAPQNRQNPQA